MWLWGHFQTFVPFDKVTLVFFIYFLLYLNIVKHSFFLEKKTCLLVAPTRVSISFYASCCVNASLCCFLVYSVLFSLVSFSFCFFCSHFWGKVATYGLNLCELQSAKKLVYYQQKKDMNTKSNIWYCTIIQLLIGVLHDAHMVEFESKVWCM